MSTKKRKNVANVLLALSLAIAAMLWAYGSKIAKEARKQEHRAGEVVEETEPAPLGIQDFKTPE